MATFSFSLILLLFLTWVIIDPIYVLRSIRSWKHTLYEYIRRREFEKSTKDFVEQFRLKAKQIGYDPEIIDEIIGEQAPVISDRIRSQIDGEYFV